MSSNSPSWKHFLSPRFIAGKVRERGVIYCARWLFKLIWQSTRPIRANLWVIPDNIRHRGKKQSNVLYAFYDLAVSPATFDIVKFLVLAELRRQEIGCGSLHIVIVPGPAGGFRTGDIELYRIRGARHHGIDYMRWRLRNILVPCCCLIPSCQQITVCTSREEAQAFQASLAKHVFPSRYTPHFPNEKHALKHFVAVASYGKVLPTIQATPEALRFVSDWIQLKAGERKIITINLRESQYELDRNSNLKAWSMFARSLDQAIYYPVFIRDIEAAFKPLPSELDGLTIFAEASWNIELRVALYELSYLNMSVNSGMNALCLYNRRVRCLTFKMLTPSSGSTTEEFFRSQGVEPGSQLQATTPYQRLIWEDDRLEVIQGAFREMCDRIERK